jgi:hypothetical protein
LWKFRFFRYGTRFNPVVEVSRATKVMMKSIRK